MNVSRRSFLRTGSKIGLAAIFTGGLTSIAFGRQKDSSLLGSGLGPVIPREALGANLYNITRARFAENLRSKFTFGLGGVKLTDLELVAVIGQTPPSFTNAGTGVRDCFLLAFRGPRDLPLRQGTYAVEHAKLGAFDLFIVPGPPGGAGREYSAVINRLHP